MLKVNKLIENIIFDKSDLVVTVYALWASKSHLRHLVYINNYKVIIGMFGSRELRRGGHFTVVRLDR